ncbi:MAG TPA: cytochrome c biogenesis protein CcsA [Opitutaceae bacterium]|jgi:ABC-type transport system involved in cytochrome c biogenesis permease subunit
MTKRAPLFIVLIAAVSLFQGLFSSPPGETQAVRDFGMLPVLSEGRIKPIDSVARSTLLVIQARQRVMTRETKEQGGVELTPDQWILDVMFSPDKADTYTTFVIDNPDVLLLIGKTPDDLRITYKEAWKQALATTDALATTRRRFSFNEISPYLAQIEAQFKLAEPILPQSRNHFQSAVVQLYGNLSRYLRIRRSVLPDGEKDLLGDLLDLQKALPEGIEAVRAKEAGKPHDEAKAAAIIDEGQKFVGMADATDLLLIPPDDAANANAWKNTGHALLESFGRGEINPAVLAYAGMGYAWDKNEAASFGHVVGLYSGGLARAFGRQTEKARIETIFNRIEPFYGCMVIYAMAFLFAILSWLRWAEPARRTAWGLVALGWVAATAGIATRMWLEGRPPVTNLYSSALFIGWGSVALCLVLEALYRNAIGSVAAGAIGFCTLLIAHHLALAGDTLEMMRAVLDSNFWLATHVVVVTTGYASTFLAGMLAVIYVLRGVFTRSLDKATADSLARMVYGIVCFATLFSFVGTALGGIWADQSWGRFWGWDPKENGALIIVIWNALILHARWGGIVRQRGLMCLAIFGNVVTSWSWFGTNMLGIGLHSYGFTEAAFWWLSAFVGIQLALIAVANIPLARWKSFQARAS